MSTDGQLNDQDNASIDEAIRRRAQAVSFGSAPAERYPTTVALDAEGVLVEYRPDGTTAPRS